MNCVGRLNGTDFLPTSDVPHGLGVAEQTVLLWARTDKLPSIRVGHQGTRVFRRDDVERIVEQLMDKRRHRRRHHGHT